MGGACAPSGARGKILRRPNSNSSTPLQPPVRIHCLREDFLDYFPFPLPLDLDPSQCTTKSSAPLSGCAPPPPKASPQEQGQQGEQGLGLPVLREALLPGSFVSPAPGYTCLRDLNNPAWQGQQAVPTLV